MKWLIRSVATAWAGSMSALAVWAGLPLIAAHPTPGVAAVNVLANEAVAPSAVLTDTAANGAPDVATQFASGALAADASLSLIAANLGGLAPPSLLHPPTAGWRTPGQAEVELAQAPPAEWLPPSWFPEGTQIMAVGGLAQEGPRNGPLVKSRSAIVYDIDAGAVLYEKNADEPRPVASITKVVSSLAWVSTNPDHALEVEIGPEQYPSRSGARSRLSTGDVTSGLDLLGAALVASDNRAALGLAAAAGMHLEQFIGRMNAVSIELGMTHSSWVDPSGLEDENLSTARDIARATLAVANHPVLAPVASAPFWDLWRKNKNYVRRLSSTDRLQGRDDLVIETAKTGYTDTARYCFTTVLESATGRRLAITLLGADGKMTRWADVSRILSWVDGGSAAIAYEKVREPVQPAVKKSRKAKKHRK